MRMIDADALEELFRETIGHIAKRPEIDGSLEHLVRASAMVIEMIKDMPTVEAAPVRHGRWVKGELTSDNWKFCSICRFPMVVRRAQWYYCPSCGAKMDEGEEDAGL